MKYGWLMAIIGIAGVLGKLISPFFILWLKNQRALQVGIYCLLLSGISMTLFAWANHITIPILLTCVSLAIFALVFMAGITMSLALSPFHDKRGSAGALYGSFQLLISFAVSASIASVPHAGTTLLAYTFLVLGILGVICYYVLVYPRSDDKGK